MASTRILTSRAEHGQVEPSMGQVEAGKAVHALWTARPMLVSRVGPTPLLGVQKVDYYNDN